MPPRCVAALTPAARARLKTATGSEVNFVELCEAKRKELGADNTNDGELAAFINYALAHPQGFLALIDTYDTLSSGCRNFLVVALALHECGYTVSTRHCGTASAAAERVARRG